MDISKILAAYRNDERGLPTYAELLAHSAEVEALRERLTDAEETLQLLDRYHLVLPPPPTHPPSMCLQH